ncbi:uncharacterized protein LOC143922637 [Arctopsyche grandis]|uniref:uncharacterized protein LOC143922637 n=1 Tax=Arctopsyche grandis TaxID=121162 RepID=UPI00406D9697
MKTTLFALTILVLQVYSAPLQDPLVLLDLSPEEAQRYINQPPLQGPILAAKTASLPLVKFNDPKFRSGESGPTNGHYWKNGIEIENTEDYVEDVYQASQFHGQDGLGAAAFGYSAPESSRLENIEANGQVKGAYTYRDPFNQLIQVKYWADGEGFHHEDNIPKVELKPVEETHEVREARLAHAQAWEEAAALARLNPDPNGEYVPSKYETEDPAPYVAPPENKIKEVKERQYKPDENEEKGPPRGFFYSFQYPVSILVPKSQVGAQGFAPGVLIDEDSVAINAQSSNARIQAIQRPVEVHDAQVPRYGAQP